MGCEIIEDRSGAVGVAWIHPTTVFSRVILSRVILALGGLLGFGFVFAHGSIADQGFSLSRKSYISAVVDHTKTNNAAPLSRLQASRHTSSAPR
jgi:hypothetical protein